MYITFILDFTLYYMSVKFLLWKVNLPLKVKLIVFLHCWCLLYVRKNLLSIFFLWLKEDDYSVLEKIWKQDPKERLILEDLIKQLLYIYNKLL